MSTTIAMTSEYTRAILMSSVLTEEGFYPAPVQRQSQVTALGGELGDRITVPRDEAGDAAAKLRARGFERFLCS